MVSKISDPFLRVIPMSADAVHGRSSLATVVIVNCNYEKFVATAIDSALEQAYQPLEVIVVDDGSTDGSRRIISAYGERIRTIFQTNSGQGAAYNAGWSAARGEFVLFLDSDDALMKDAMTKIVAAFQRSDAVKVQFYLQQVDRGLKPLGHLLPSYNFTRIEPRDQIANYGYYVSPPASGNAFRKRFLDDIMPVENEALYRIAADGYTTGIRFPYLKLTRRFAVAIGFLVLGLLPRSMLRRLFGAITSAQKRNDAVMT
jgi:glycosyltransferase involved in cell wall biosynthesis